MTADAVRRLRAGRPKLALVIFDCDGVLIDSEPLCDRVVAETLTELGWPITATECHRRFIGLSFYDMQPTVEAQLNRPLGPDWVDGLVARLTGVLAAEVEAIPGARSALEAATVLGLAWRVASNSSHLEMAAKFGRTGLSDLMAGRTHSAIDVIAVGGHGKPAPDLFLAAASAEGVAPGACLVIEDSVAGVRAAAAAGMDCLGFAPADDGSRLRAEGALPFHAMDDLPGLLRAARDAAA
ncbi:MAG TPA: HAD-IA family hydrolase [Acetobacteraceae bacterium]|nr:HAD-IA family hydrolase [Acetobacteraceae bacterium]